jgi:hypothetical protein
VSEGDAWSVKRQSGERGPTVTAERVNTEVSFGKGAAGTGLQVALEGDCALLVGEFDGDVKSPGTVASSVGAAARVVIGEAGVHIVCQTNVGTTRITQTAQEVDEALRCHAWLGASPPPRDRSEEFFGTSCLAEQAMHLLPAL